MRQPTFLLIGIGGVYNYGCEAIVRGTEIILRREYPEAEIVYASPRPVDDRRRLTGSQVLTIERGRRQRYSFKNIARKALSAVGVQWHPRSDSLTLLKNVSAVFSVGGDLYTLDPNGDFARSFVKFGDAVRRRNLPYILWGASVGPFAENPAAQTVFTRHLKRLSLITSRERETTDYLRSLGIYENVEPCADPAFAVAPEITTGNLPRDQRLTIGINLSPLSIRLAGLNRSDAIRSQSQMLERLVDTLDAQIVLIPHVICDFNEDDDDLRYLRSLRDAVAADYQSAVTLVESDLGFVGTKRELVKCHIVVASRMHCAINALAAHVPTILVSYSHKASGMCEYVYRNGDWLLSIETLTQEGVLENMIRTLEQRRSEVLELLARRVPEIRLDAYAPMSRVRELL